MKYLVTVADDFGFTKGINKGCIEAHNEGILTEMSLMMDSPATDEGITMALTNDVKGLGIHITLNDIVGTGTYLRTDDYKKLLAESSEKKLSNRVMDELKKFEDLVGRVPTHINGHKNSHLHPKILDTVSEYALKHSIYVRRSTVFSDGNSAGEDVNPEFIERGVRITDQIFEHIVGSYRQAADGFIKDLETAEDNTVTEIFLHPAYVDDMLRNYSSLLEDRERDLRLLLDKNFKERIEDMVFSIVGFSEVQKK